MDADDIVYIPEHNGGLVSVLTLDGERLARWGDPSFRSCHGIWGDSHGDIYVRAPGRLGPDPAHRQVRPSPRGPAHIPTKRLARRCSRQPVISYTLTHGDRSRGWRDVRPRFVVRARWDAGRRRARRGVDAGGTAPISAQGSEPSMVYLDPEAW